LHAPSLDATDGNGIGNEKGACNAPLVRRGGWVWTTRRSPRPLGASASRVRVLRRNLPHPALVGAHCMRPFPWPMPCRHCVQRGRTQCAPTGWGGFPPGTVWSSLHSDSRKQSRAARAVTSAPPVVALMMPLTLEWLSAADTRYSG
jgi:hypothetical protein